jgi:hypothetical protein
MNYIIHPRQKNAHRICDSAGRLLTSIEYKNWLPNAEMPFSDLFQSGELNLENQVFQFIAFSDKRTQKALGTSYETGIVLCKNGEKICDMDGQFALEGVIRFKNAELIFEGRNYLSLILGFSSSKAFTIKSQDNKILARFKPGHFFNRFKEIDIDDSTSSDAMAAALVLAVCAPLVTATTTTS